MQLCKFGESISIQVCIDDKKDIIHVKFVGKLCPCKVSAQFPVCLLGPGAKLTP